MSTLSKTDLKCYLHLDDSGGYRWSQPNAYSAVNSVDCILAIKLGHVVRSPGFAIDELGLLLDW